MTIFVAALVALGVGLALAGCGGDDDDAIADLSFGVEPDLSIGKVNDLAVDIDAGPIDLAVPADLTPRVFDLAWSACAGTKLAGTCAEAFFEPFVACFQPSGVCGNYVHNSGSEYCWQSGARYHQPILAASYFYSNGLGRCLTAYRYDSQGVIQFCAPNDSSCGGVPDDGGLVSRPSGGALYDTQSGIFTCLDGTQVDVGPPPTPYGIHVGDCSVLNALLDPRPLCDPATFNTSCNAF